MSFDFVQHRQMRQRVTWTLQKFLHKNCLSKTPANKWKNISDQIPITSLLKILQAHTKIPWKVLEIFELLNPFIAPFEDADTCIELKHLIIYSFILSSMQYILLNSTKSACKLWIYMSLLGFRVTVITR